MPIVIDSSAVLALLLDEPGAEIVEAALADAMISTVNMAECVEIVERRGLDWTEIEDVITIATLAIEPLALGTAIAAGKMAKLTRSAGLSLGDRCCLALAIEHQAETLTADRDWAQFAEPLGLKIRVIR